MVLAWNIGQGSGVGRSDVLGTDDWALGTSRCSTASGAFLACGVGSAPGLASALPSEPLFVREAVAADGSNATAQVSVVSEYPEGMDGLR